MGADSPSFPPWVQVYGPLVGALFESLESIPDTVKKSYCHRCSEVLSSYDLGTSPYRVSLSLSCSEFESCILCNIFLSVSSLNTDSAFFADELRRLRTFEIDSVPKNGTDSEFDVEAIRVSESPPATSSTRFYYTINLYAKSDDPSPRFISARTPTRNLWSDENIALANRWMKECLETHDHPSIITEGDHPELPTRVLKVSATSAEGTVQLYCSHSQESAPYAALSYCWGSLTQPIQLEGKTFSKLVNDLPVSEFPKTVIDAINVTRKLGLKYLWVDALCILQDSELNKVKEIRKMAHIYQQAHVTIAAGNAKSVQDGFLYAPADPMKNGRWIEMPFRKLGRVYGTCGRRKSLDPEQEPLSQRAWTLQETLLSRRLLIFDSQIMRWQCPQHQYMEEWGQSNLDIPVLRCLSSLRFEDLRREAPRYSVRYELTRWHAILALYTARQLRYGSDKLDALSAVAQEAARYIPSQYTAGLWSEFLEYESCWFVPSHNQHPPAEYVAPRYRGPSWSWISVDNVKIDHKTRGGSFDAEILKCEAQLVSNESPFGEVMSGRLVIRGLLARATRSTRESLRRRVPGFEYSFGINDRFWQGIFFFDRKEDDDPNRDWTNNYLLGIWEKQGLILEKMDDGQFKRIGLSYWGWLRSQTRQKWNVLPEAEYTIISII